jgi:GT2 family glycosyltransferase
VFDQELLPDDVPLLQENPAETPADDLVDDEYEDFATYLEQTAEEAVEVARRPHHVTAVLVAHNGSRWLKSTLLALGRLPYRPDRIIAVDTGSSDDTPEILERARAEAVIDDIVTADAATGFGQAVAMGVERAGRPDEDELARIVLAGLGLDAADGDVPAEDLLVDPEVAPEVTVQWIWILHDDSAPEPQALEGLLLTADSERTAEVLGPKLRGWNNQDQLVSVGVTVARSGNQVDGLERRELDQGQHDGRRDVLAVSSAGMLVRRDVWDALDGFDPALAFFRDDIDFCWRARRAGYRVMVTSDSIVHHREAATHGRREVNAGSPKYSDRPGRIDRSASIHLMRAHSTGLTGFLVTLRLLVGSLVRALVRLIGKAPDQARDEWGAFRDALRDRTALRESRQRVALAAAMPASVPEADVRTLLAPRGMQARIAWERVADAIAGRDSDDSGRSALESTTDDPDGWYADDRRPSRIQRFLRQPATLVGLILLGIALIGERALLGSGVLVGGALVPAPEGAGDLWAMFTQGWHEVGVGSSADSPAWLVPLTLLSGAMRGSASMAVDMILLLCIPFAGLSMYLATRPLLSLWWARAWAAVAYATLPAVTGAVSGGRIGSAVAIVLLPWAVSVCAPLVGIGRPATWRRVFGTSLLLGTLFAFVPLMWAVMLVVAATATFTFVQDRSGRTKLWVAALLPFALLVPWGIRVLRDPALLWLEPGLLGPTDAHLNAFDVLLLRPGGPGSSSILLGIGFVLAGLVALLMPGSRRAISILWSLGFIGFVFAVVQSVIHVTPQAFSSSLQSWPGATTALWGGALIVAIAIAAQRMPAMFIGADFGIWQVIAGVLAVLLLGAPGYSLFRIATGVDGPLHRGTRDVLPAFVAAEMHTPLRPRTVVLMRDGGQIRYDLMSVPEPALGDIDVAPPASLSAQLDLIVGRMAAGLGADEIDSLATHGVQYVLLADAGKHDELVDTLDGERGLRRVSTRNGQALWQVVSTSSRVQALEPSAVGGVGSVAVRRSLAVPTTSDDPRTVTNVDTTVGKGASGRQLLMSEALDSRWRWTVGGQRVQPVSPSIPGPTSQTDPSLQQVPLAPSATPAVVSFDGSGRQGWITAELIAVALVVLFALPSRRREEDDDEDVSGDESPGQSDDVASGQSGNEEGEAT